MSLIGFISSRYQLKTLFKCCYAFTFCNPIITNCIQQRFYHHRRYAIVVAPPFSTALFERKKKNEFVIENKAYIGKLVLKDIIYFWKLYSRNSF